MTDSIEFQWQNAMVHFVGLFLLPCAVASMDASRALVAYAKAGPIFVSSAVRARGLEARARAVEEAAAQQRPPEWPRDADLLCKTEARVPRQPCVPGSTRSGRWSACPARDMTETPPQMPQNPPSPL